MVYQIDSFTKETFKGNPAGVVYNADGLSDEQMKKIARELNNSETAFILPPTVENAHGRIRYFTPTTEVPICGHATIAAMYVKALEEDLESSVFNMQTKAGVLPFEVIKKANDYKIIMTQGKIEFSEPFDKDISNRIIKAIGLTATDLDSKCPIQIVSTGHSKVLIGIRSKETLNQLKPDYLKLIELSNEIHCNGYYVFVLGQQTDDILIHGRMFAPAVGINEDPVTGNANGPLGAYLIKHKLVNYNKDMYQFKIQQGQAINRVGHMEVQVIIKDDQPSQIRIIGQATTVFKTKIHI